MTIARSALRSLGRGGRSGAPFRDLDSAGRTWRVRWRRVAALMLALVGASLLLRGGDPAPREPVWSAPLTEVIPHEAGVLLAHGEGLYEGRDPGFIPTEVGLARALAHDRCAAGDHTGALELLLRAGELDGYLNLDLLHQRAVELAHAGHLDASLAHLGGLLEHDPRRAGVWDLRGQLRLERAELEGAVADTTRALQLAPRLAAAWATRAQARLALGDLEGAAADAEQALAIDPSQARAWEARAGLALTRGQLGAAGECLARARACDLGGARSRALDELELTLAEARLGAR